jgi:DNA-binding beta-propeller fold protein YncE
MTLRTVVSGAAIACVTVAASAANAYRSPEHVAFSADGAWLAVSDATAASVVLLDGAAGAVKSNVALKGMPRGLAWGGGSVYVAEYDAGTVAEVDAASGAVKRRLAVGPKPWGVAMDAAGGRLLVSEFGLAQLIVVDLASGKETGRVPMIALPRYIAVMPDGSSCLVANSVPMGDARKGTHACAISMVDLKTLARTANISLPPGSINPRGIAISPDGKWAYVVHNLGRFTLPTTQLERGWVMTNAMTILDLTKREVYATLLLDTISRGSADPWGLALSPDGKTAWVTLAGCAEAVRLNMDLLHVLMDGKASPEALNRFPGESVWKALVKEPAKRADLVNDLAALYISGAKTTAALPGKGCRGVAVTPKGDKVVVAEFFSGTLAVADTAAESPAFTTVAVGPQPAADTVRRGEESFHSADLCFQRWLSCASCHPEARAEGLNWDLLNDGLGNPKNTKNMVWSHKTPPAMAHGVRASMEVATEKGFMFIQFRIVEDAIMDDVRAYLRSLEPEKSPYLVNGELSAKAKKGKALFESDKVGCAKCHPAPLFTDLKTYDVGTRHEWDSSGDFDNPTCVEMWRSAPYLHDGSAATLKDLLTTLNPEDRHGNTSKLSAEEVDALVEYLLSL